ncbi:hypothetical protein HOY80DRAFT_953386, partial [Tuber brumale]
MAVGLRARRGATPNKQTGSKCAHNTAPLRLGPGPGLGSQKAPATCLVSAKTFQRPGELKLELSHD